MPNPPLRSRPAAAGPRQRTSMTAAARAAAKRSASAEDRRGAAPVIAPEAVPGAETEREQAAVPVPVPVPALGRDREPESVRDRVRGDVTEQAAEEAEAERAGETESAGEAGTAAEGEAEAAAGTSAVGPAGRRNRVLSAGLAVLVVAALVAGAVLAGDYRHGERTRQAGTQALAAARTAAPVVLSYDYRHLDQDFAAALGHLTGPFRDEYRKTTGTVVAPTARQYHAVVTATVAQPAGGEPAASVVSASPGRVVVLLFMNQVTRSTRLDAPRLDLNRVRMTLSRTAAGWKVSAVDAL